MLNLGKSREQRSIAAYLIVYIILFSSAVTLLTTSLQLYREYERDVDAVSAIVEQLRISHIDSLTSSIWALDSQQVHLTIDGIARLADIRRVEVLDDNAIAYSTGEVDQGASRSYSFPLIHREGDREFALGELRIVVDLRGIYGRLFDRIWLILLSNGAKTFAVSAFLFLIFQRFVTRHLQQIASHAQRLSPETLDQPLKLDRPARSGPPDEIDRLVMAVNDMRGNLHQSYTALSESERRFRYIAERVDAVFWISSSDWQSVLYVSPAYERVWGRPCAELYKSPLAWMEPIHADDMPMVKDTIATAAGALPSTGGIGPQPVHFAPYRIMRSDGTVRWVSARAFPITDEGGRNRRVVGIAEDITQQVETDMALIEAKELAEQSSEAKSRFLSHMSHELRTPLNAILGFSEMMEREILGPLQPTAYRDYARDIHKSGEHLLTIINDILDLSRIESGETVFHFEELEPRSLIDEASKYVNPLANTKSIDIEIGLPPDLPAITGDRRAVVQVLINIINNAVKFTPPGGAVQMTGKSRTDGGVDLQIADNGCGIAAAELSELFNPFVTKNALMARPEEGTGLGLAISKRLMLLQGFDIAIDSTVGTGTKVTLQFPKSPPGAPGDGLPAALQNAV